MTKVSNRLDLSFLNEEEVSKILAVLERDEQLKRAERDRVSKLQSTKRDIKWLHGVSGEWFEEIQRKKFRNDPDVSSILRQPLTYRLRRITRYDSTDFKMSRTKSQKNTATSPSILGFRSPFTSLFSFRKLEKQSAKPQSQQKGHGIFSLTGHSTSGIGRKTKIGMSDSPQNIHAGNLFGTNLGRMRGRTMSSTDAELENEAFHVLDDLDNKLAHEQTQSFTSYKAPMSHKPRRQYQSQYLMESGYSDTLEHQNDYRKTSSMFLNDGRRKLSFNEEYRTCSTYRPSKFHDMYSNRHRTVSHHDFTGRDTFGRSPSLSSISHGRPCSSPASFTTFSASSLHLPSLRQRNSGFLPRSSHQEAKRKPISSIIWNNPHCNEHAQNHGVLPKTHSLMELNSCANQDISPLPLQQNRMYEFYQSKNLYRRPMSKAYHFGRNQVTSPVFWDNPDHNPFYQSEYNARESYIRAISQEDVMEIDNSWETENKENYSSHLYNRDIIPSPYIRSHSNCNNMIINVNEQELAPANSIVHHSQHSFASTFMPADDDMVEEMKDDLDFQPLPSENARNEPFAEEINTPKIFNTTIDLKNQNSLSSNSTITLHSFIPGISTTSESVESRDQIKCNGQHEDSIANVIDTDVNVNQLQFPLTEVTTEMEVQTHLSENVNMQSVHETHTPTISNNTVDQQNSPHGATINISNVGDSVDSKDQIKLCAQCSDLNIVGTCASKNDPQFHVTQVNTDQDIQMCVEENSDMDPSNKTSYCIDNASKKYIIPQPIYSRVASRCTSNLQSSQSNISASALNASTPNITKELAVHSLNSRDQSKTEPMQKNAKVQTSNYFETTVLRKGNDFRSTSKNNKYTSLLLINQSRNSLSLSNLNQLKHFHQNSSEMSDMKLENMKQESTRNLNGPDSQIQEQSPLGKCIQKDVVNTPENSAALSDSFCNVLPNHKDKLIRLPKVSSEHSQNPLPNPLPSNNFTYLDTPIISSLNCKNTEAPNVGRKQPVMRSHIEENITSELSQKQFGVANCSSEPTVSYSQNKNGETAHAPSFSDLQGQSGSQSKAVSQTFLLSSKEAFPDPNTNRQHTKLTISCKPSRLMFQDAKTIKEEYLNNLVPNNLVKISNNFEDLISNDTVPSTCMLSQHLNLISTNEDTQNRTQTSPDLNRYTHLESMWLDKRISSYKDVVPCTKLASSEVSPLSSESLLAKQKRIHSDVPEKSFTIITDLTECKLNSTHSPDKENEDLSSTDSINTNEKLQNNTANSCTSVSHCPNDDTSVKPSALYCSVRRSADDINTLPRYKNTAISSSSSKLLFPSRRTLDQLPARLFNRIVAPFSHHESISTVSDTEHSPLTAKTLEVHTDINKNTRQEKHRPEEVYKSECPISNPTSIDNVSVKVDESVRTHPCPSDGLDKESNLQKRETNSTVFVSSDPGNIEYQQSRSVYSSLPNKRSRALSDVLLNRRNANLLCPNSTENKNYEFHIKVATVTFPDSLNSNRPESSDKILSNSTTQQHSNFANKLNSRSVCNQEDIAQPPRPPLLSRPTQPAVRDAADPDVPVQAQNTSLAVEKSLNDAHSMANTENIRTYFSIIPGSHEKIDDLCTRIPLRFNSSVPEKPIPCQEQEASGANDATDHLQTRVLKKWQQFQNERSNNIKKNVLQIYSPEDTNRNFHKGQKQTDIKPEATYSENTPVECGQKEKSEAKGGGKAIYKEISPESERSDLNVRETGYCRGTIDNEITSAITVLSNSNNSSCQAFCEDPTPTLQRFQPSVRNVIGTEISYEQNRTEQEPMAEEQIIDKKVTGLQMSMKPFGVHMDYFEDEVFDVSPELQQSTKAPKCNNVIFDYTNSGNTISEKLIESVYKTEWDSYPRTNPNYSSQNLSQAHYAVNDALHKEGNISYVDISKPQNASLLPSHLQSLHESGNHSQVLKRASNVTTTSMQRINQNKNVFKDRSKPISPTARCSERPTMHRKSWKNKINGSKQSTVEEVVGHTKPSFYSTNLQNELIAAKNRNIQMFNVTADSSNVHNSLDSYQDSPLMISSVDNNSNTITKNCRQPSMCVQQEDTSLGECGSMNEYQDIYQSKNFKNLNLLDDTADMMDMKKYSRRFSSATSFDRTYSRCPSISTFSPDGKQPRNFSSFSEVSSNDVNDNWTFCYNRNRSYNTRKNKSIDFGIFGKEQQAAFLENIKRSLTEGRLWRPCFLKNPGFLRNEINATSNRSGFLSASSPGSRMSIEGLSLGEPLNIYQEEAVIYSESDNDTTTDDEYYLDDYDKESEL
ncbi:exophilin-5 [Microcaecilia unicolor]|uniref:Exophilin-5 n=1 Tax=Microcaecilia unicolor TaxID=1415580 RepID=A0A6P7XZE3_9AMPH|nr:exophilin-5 [Microcaecilia unicolor]